MVVYNYRPRILSTKGITLHLWLNLLDEFVAFVESNDSEHVGLYSSLEAFGFAVLVLDSRCAAVASDTLHLKPQLVV